MFGNEEIISWMFAVVASALVKRAEATEEVYRSADYKPGAVGVAVATGKPVYWEGTVRWSVLDTPPGRALSVAQFRNLLYHLHPPTSTAKTAVIRALMDAEEVAVDGNLTPDAFRDLVTRFPILLSPIFVFQTTVRHTFMGADWWGAKREIFTNARGLLQDQFERAAQQAIMERQARVSCWPLYFAPGATVHCAHHQYQPLPHDNYCAEAQGRRRGGGRQRGRYPPCRGGR